MEETTGQGGRRAQKAKRKASQEERNQVSAFDHFHPLLCENIVRIYRSKTTVLLIVST